MKIVFYIINIVILSQTAIAIPNFEIELQERVKEVRKYSELKQMKELSDQFIHLRKSCEIEKKAQEIPFNCYKYLALLKKYQISLAQIARFENEIENSCATAVVDLKSPFAELKTAELSSFKCRELVREKNAEILYIQQSSYK